MTTVYYESYYGSLPSPADYIEHHGIKGQKWYHRRFQNSDGTLTPAGRARYGVGPARKALTKEERAAARAKAKEEKAENKRVAYSEKMQQKYGLIDVPPNRDAAVDNTRDMIDKGASSGEVKKYLKLNNLDKEQINQSLENIRTRDTAKKFGASKEEIAKLLRARDAGDTEGAKQGLDEIKKRYENQQNEADKAAAIASGDPKRIEKYISDMSNQELQNALNRIDYRQQIDNFIKTGNKQGTITKKDGLLKRIGDRANDVYNIANNTKKIADLFEGADKKSDSVLDQAYRESLKNKASADAAEIRKLAEKAGLSAKETENLVKNRYAELYNGGQQSKALKALFETRDALSKNENDGGGEKNEGQNKGKNKEQNNDSGKTAAKESPSLSEMFLGATGDYKDAFSGKKLKVPISEDKPSSDFKMKMSRMPSDLLDTSSASPTSTIVKKILADSFTEHVEVPEYTSKASLWSRIEKKGVPVSGNTDNGTSYKPAKNTKGNSFSDIDIDDIGASIFSPSETKASWVEYPDDNAGGGRKKKKKK